MHEKLNDLETKIILLIQVAKSSTDGTPSGHIFDGIGEVMNSIDYLKEMMKGQYAKLSEFKETEKSVETLNTLYMEGQEEKVKESKEKEKLIERIDDLKNSMNHLNNEMMHLKDERFKTFEDQLVEKLDYNEFEMTINNIREYLETLATGDATSKFMKQDSSRNIVGFDEFNKINRDKSNSSITEELSDEEEAKKYVSQKRVSPALSRKQSTENIQEASPTLSGRQSLVGSPTKLTRRGTMSAANPVSLSSKAVLQSKKTIKKTPNFISKETIRFKELERKMKDLEEKIANIVKNSKNDIIPMIEKRLLGIREELENKASTLDLKKLLPQINEATESSKKMKSEMIDIKENGLIGDKGKKAEQDISLALSRLGQVEGKFQWLHNSHKDIMKKVQESLSASQPLMMNAVDVNAGSQENISTEVKEDLDRIKRDISSINSKIKEYVNELKIKISEKVDDRALNDLEDQLTTDLDQTIKSFTKKFAEKQDTK